MPKFKKEKKNTPMYLLDQREVKTAITDYLENNDNKNIT